MGFGFALRDMFDDLVNGIGEVEETRKIQAIIGDMRSYDLT